MKKYIVFVWAVLLLAACNSTPEKHKVGVLTLEDNQEVVTKYINGNPNIVRTFEEKDGARTYVYQKEYYEDGNLLKEGALKDGKRNGVWKSYYKDGKLWSEGEFVNGKMEGKTTSYHPNGQVRYSGEFKNGVKFGEWRFYDEDGKLLEIKYFAEAPKKDTVKANQ